MKGAPLKFPVLVTLSTLGILLGMTVFFPDNLGRYPWGQSVNLLSELGWNKGKDVTGKLEDNFAIDSLLNQALAEDTFNTPQPVAADSMLRAPKIFSTDALSIQDFSNDSLPGMEQFYLALLEAEETGRPVRIAYFGDSMIEGDLVTDDLRKMLQKLFGGQGLGFVPITSVVADFRANLKHKFSDNWKDFHFNNTSKDHPLGPSGHVFVPGKNAWVELESPKGYRSFGQIRLYFGPTEGTEILVRLDTLQRKIRLQGKNKINTLVLNDTTARRKLYLEVLSGSTAFYGFSMEGKNRGIILDNFAFRGNSGVPLGGISTQVYQDWKSQQPYDLIILHYGLNVVAHGMEDYGWYASGMSKAIAQLRRNFPHTALLLVSVSDKGYRHEGNWISEPAIPGFVNLQKKLAQSRKIAFWNLYQNMGGDSAIIRWVQDEPIMAGTDYTHLNSRGSRKVAEMLYNNILQGYQEFKTLYRKEEQP